MVEQVYKYSLEDTTAVEKIIMDENVNYIHMVFPNGEGMPEHFANSNVYMSVIRGILSIQLDEQEDHKYPKGSLLEIPYNTKMNVRNKDEGVLELFVVKAPAPKNYKE